MFLVFGFFVVGFSGIAFGLFPAMMCIRIIH